MGGALGMLLLLAGMGLIVEESSPERAGIRAGVGVLLLLMGIGLVLGTRATSHW